MLPYICPYSLQKIVRKHILRLFEYRWILINDAINRLFFFEVVGTVGMHEEAILLTVVLAKMLITISSKSMYARRIACIIMERYDNMIDFSKSSFTMLIQVQTLKIITF